MDSPGAPGGGQAAPVGPEVAPEPVSAHQVAAFARILGLNPDDVVSVHALQTHVDVVLYVPPAAPADVRHPLLRTVRYLVQR